MRYRPGIAIPENALVRQFLALVLLVAAWSVRAQPVDLDRQPPDVQEAYGLLNNATAENLGRAKQLLDAALAKRPDDAFVLCELARHAMKYTASEGRLELSEALRFLERAAAAAPDRADTYVLLGYVETQRGKLPAALAHLERAEKLGTTNVWLQANFADLYWAMRDFPAALERSRKVLAHPAATPSAVDTAATRLINTYTVQGAYPSPEVAREVWRRKLEVYPGHPVYWEGYAEYLIFDEGAIDEGVDAAVKSGTDRAHLYAGAGKLMLAARAPSAQQAAALVEEARALSPNFSQVMYELVVKKGEDTKALKLALAAGASVDYVNRDGLSALHIASMWYDVDTVNVLLDAGANPNLECQIGTPVFLAVFPALARHTPPPGTREVLFADMPRRERVLKALLERGGDPHRSVRNEPSLAETLLRIPSAEYERFRKILAAQPEAAPKRR